MSPMQLGRVAMVAVAYVVGMFPTAQLVGRAFGHDPLREGSGNPGASNVYRTAGRGAGLVVLLGDVAKGGLPTLAALVVGGRGLALVCWVAAVIGHVVPLVRAGRGGKGVATAGGGALVLSPFVAIGLLAVFVVVVRRTKIAALGSLAMAVLLPVGVALVHRRLADTMAAAAVALVVVARHHANVSRILAGTEHTVGAG